MNAELLLKQAAGLVKTRDLLRARELVTQVLELEPDNVWAWALMSHVAKDKDEASRARDQVRRLKPSNIPIDQLLSGKSLAQIDEWEKVQRANKLAKDGQPDAARELIQEVLKNNSENPHAWMAMARLPQSKEETVFALQEVLRLDPDNQWAREQLAQLRSDEEDKSGVLVTWILGAGIGLLIVILLLLLFMRPPDQQPAVSKEKITNLSMASCQDFIKQALAVSDESCQATGLNQVCYGNYFLEADLLPSAAGQFQTTGDVIPLDLLRTLQASPLDFDQGSWGIAIFKLQADLPRTVPGQAVTFLAFGNTSVDNTSGDMQAIYFSTGLGNVTCEQVPFDGILVQAPEGVGYSFQANGVDFEFFGTLFLKAERFGQFVVDVLTGSARVSANGQTEVIEPGQQAVVNLGGGGLDPEGPPRLIESPLTDGPQIIGCTVLGINCPPKIAESLTDTPMPTQRGQLTNTPVPVDPGQPTNTSVPVDPDLPTNTSVPSTPGQPTNTPVPMRTNTPVPVSTNTPVSQKTNTPVPGSTSTPVPTDTPAPTATDTPIPTNTPVPTATNTPIPTNTPVPTATNTPIPTNTPVPTATNTTEPPPVCTDITLTWVGVNEPPISDPTILVIDVTNNIAVPVVLAETTINWSGPDLSKIKLGAATIWNAGGAPQSPPQATVVLNESAVKRTVNPGATLSLQFSFSSDAPSTGYTVSLTIDGGCTSNISSSPN